MGKERGIVVALVVALLLPVLATAPRVAATLAPASEGPVLAPIEGLRAGPDIQVDSPDDGHEAAHAAGGLKERGRTQLQNSTSCDKDINRTGRIRNLRFVAAVNNGLCQNTDVDAYSTGTRHYVIQGSRRAGVAYTHYDVTNPARPAIVGRYRWGGAGASTTKTASSKTFRRGSRYYAAIGLERLSGSAYCGVAIFDITTPASPVKTSQYIGSGWCDTHNVFVEKDAAGEGLYVYATANLPNDLRVLDISGRFGGSVSKPREIGRYIAPGASDANWVHDITVVDHGGAIGRRVYLAYWYAGLVILDADDVTPGRSPRPIVGPYVIDPPGYRTHHAVPNAAGTRVFIQDEFQMSSSARPVQMWNISNIPARRPTYVDGLRQNVGVNGRLHYAHNLLRIGTTLYVAWYTAGLQAFTFTDDGFVRRSRYHQVQTEGTDGGWDGAWSIVTLVINGKRYYFQADMNYGLIVSST